MQSSSSQFFFSVMSVKGNGLKIGNSDHLILTHPWYHCHNLSTVPID